MYVSFERFFFFNIALLLAASDHRVFVFWLINCFSKNMELQLFGSNIQQGDYDKSKKVDIIFMFFLLSRTGNSVGLIMINRFSPILYINRIFCGDMRKVIIFFLNSKAVNKHGHVVFHDFRKQIINSQRKQTLQFATIYSLLDKNAKKHKGQLQLSSIYYRPKLCQGRLTEQTFLLSHVVLFIKRETPTDMAGFPPIFAGV